MRETLKEKKLILLVVHVHCIKEREREGGIDNEEERELGRIKWATKMS